jgi:hypothetical protein
MYGAAFPRRFMCVTQQLIAGAGACATDKPNGTNKINLFSLNFPQDGVVSFEVGGEHVPAPVSEEVAALAWAQFPCVPQPARCASTACTRE